MGRSIVEELLTDFTVFLSGNTELGTADVQLPKIQYLTNTTKGAGFAGEINSIIPGFTGPMPITLTWRNTVSNENAQLLAPISHYLVFRGAVQAFDRITGGYREIGKTVSVRTMPTGMDLGKAQTATSMDGSMEMECTYIRIEEDGKELIEIDKVNYIFKVNGFDYLANRRNILGR